jgi:hypothetical protein
MVVLESEDGTRLSLADIFGLRKAYSKKEPTPPSMTTLRLSLHIFGTASFDSFENRQSKNKKPARS